MRLRLPLLQLSDRPRWMTGAAQVEWNRLVSAFSPAVIDASRVECAAALYANALQLQDLAKSIGPNHSEWRKTKALERRTLDTYRLFLNDIRSHGRT